MTNPEGQTGQTQRSRTGQKNSTGYGAKLNPWWIGSCPPSNPSGDWVLSPGARHYPMGGVGHSSATMSIFLETKAPHESTLLDLCMVHMTCSSLQQLNIRYWSYICTCVSDIQFWTRSWQVGHTPRLRAWPRYHVPPTPCCRVVQGGVENSQKQERLK